MKTTELTIGEKYYSPFFACNLRYLGRDVIMPSLYQFERDNGEKLYLPACAEFERKRAS